jgi:hypothetical protein
MNQKQNNREELERVAEYVGDLFLSELFWNMFDDLSAANQKKYIAAAKAIVERERGFKV